MPKPHLVWLLSPYLCAWSRVHGAQMRKPVSVVAETVPFSVLCTGWSGRWAHAARTKRKITNSLGKADGPFFIASESWQVLVCRSKAIGLKELEQGFCISILFHAQKYGGQAFLSCHQGFRTRPQGLPGVPRMCVLLLFS